MRNLPVSLRVGVQILVLVVISAELTLLTQSLLNSTNMPVAVANIFAIAVALLVAWLLSSNIRAALQKLEAMVSEDDLAPPTAITTPFQTLLTQIETSLELPIHIISNGPSASEKQLVEVATFA